MINMKSLKEQTSELNVLYVEDNIKLQEEVSTYLRKIFKMVITSNDGVEGLEKYPTSEFDLVITDINMPKMSGLTMCTKIKEINPNQKILIVSAATDVEDFATSILIGVDGYIIKPIEFNQLKNLLYKITSNINNQKLLNQYHEDLEKKIEQRTKEITQTRLELIRCLGRASDYRDNDTGLHVIRMSYYSRILTKELFPNDNDFINLIYNAAPLHDVGKIGIPDAILLKPGKFNKEEWAIMKNHSVYGSEIIDKDDSLLMKTAKEIAIAHHEKWNGTGYPQGLKEYDIPLSARIIAIADVFDALTTRRPYKNAWTSNEAIEYINAQSGISFDPEIVSAFNNVIDEFIEIKENYKEKIENDMDLIL